MEKSTIKLKQISGVFLWELRKQYFSIRYPIIAGLGLLLVILIMPQSVCQHWDVHANLLVNIINLAFAMSFIFSSFYLVFYKLTVPYGTIEYQKERTSDIGIPIRLGIRVLLNALSCAVILLYGVGASYGMEKFADYNHRYLFIKFDNGLFYTYLIYFIFVPLVFLTLFLRRYVVDLNKYYFSPFIISVITAGLWLQIKDFMFRTFTNWPALLIHIIFTLMTLILCALLFYQCCRYEE